MRVISVIQPIKNRQVQLPGLNNLKDINKAAMGKQEILTIYEAHLQVTSPTYSEDVKAVMKKEDIAQTSLNAKVIETMNKTGVDVTKQALGTIVNQLQEAHLFELFTQGYDIEQLTVDIIAEEITNNEIIVQGQTKIEESSSVNKDIIQALAEAGLSDTDKNLEILKQYKEKIEVIMASSDSTISNMIRHKSDITINNLYTANHRGVSKDRNTPPTPQQIIAVLNMNGIKPTQENINAATNLVRDNIEVTSKNVADFTRIKRIMTELDPKELVETAAQALKKGVNPGDIKIDEQAAMAPHLSYNQVDEIVKDIRGDIPRIDEHVIETAYRNNKAITMENLQKVLHENVGTVLKGNKEGEDQETDLNAKEEADHIATTKRQLEEIRLSLTLNAALKLSTKLDIQTTELSKVVEGLKVIEKEHNESILKNAGAPVTDENIEHIRQTADKLHAISQNKAFAMSQVVEDKADFTLEGMDLAIKQKNAQNTYQEAATKPERRFGEGIRRVEDQIGHILQMNEIKPSDANIKAAKALVQNNIDISQEAIEAAKIVLLKIETVTHKLRPAVVAQMLKDGIRPDTMPVDELIGHIRQIEGLKQADPRQRLAEGILSLDKANQLSSAEREGLVAVYRMLKTITKNETAAIGFLINNDHEPTLGNLFEASKYIQQVGTKTGKMDVRVDDKLGIRQGELPANIRHLIGEATSKGGPATDVALEAAAHTKNVIHQWLSRITPSELKRYIDMDKSLEDIALSDGELSSFEAERMTKQVSALDKLSPHTLTFLREHKMPLTIPNIYWTDKMIKNPYLLGDTLKDYENLTGEEIQSVINNSSKQNIEEILNTLEKELDEQSSKWLTVSQNAQAYNIGKELEQLLSTQKQIAKHEGMYQIPVELHHGMSNLNVYVKKDKEGSNKAQNNELRAYMSIKTQNIGVIQVNMRLSDKAVAFEMIGETPEVTFGLQKSSRDLKAAIEAIGYNVMQAKFSQGKAGISMTDAPKASASLLKYRFEESKFEHII